MGAHKDIVRSDRVRVHDGPHRRGTVKVRVFPNEASLERLVSAVLVEIDDRWAADAKAYIKWECQDA